MLATLVEVYEAKHFAIPDARPLAAIRFVMEQNRLIAKDLTRFIGSSGRASEVLSGLAVIIIIVYQYRNQVVDDSKNYSMERSDSPQTTQARLQEIQCATFLTRAAFVLTIHMLTLYIVSIRFWNTETRRSYEQV